MMAMTMKLEFLLRRAIRRFPAVQMTVSQRITVFIQKYRNAVLVRIPFAQAQAAYWQMPVLTRIQVHQEYLVLVSVLVLALALALAQVPVLVQALVLVNNLVVQAR